MNAITPNFDPKLIKRLESEVFFSTDVESDGPCPGLNSMLSMGCVAFTLKEGFIAEFERNLEVYPGAKPDPKTQEFWAKNPEAYAATQIDQISPRQAMWDFVQFVNDTAGKRRPVFAAYPAGYDFTYIYWYLHATNGVNPFKWQAWDLKSYASAVLKKPFKDTVKSHMPKEWFSWMQKTRNTHTHIASDDAREQASIMIAVMCENLGLKNPL